ncbi:MAG: hypothetical protein LBS70_03970 [Candidatus Accumulibacter sp.]|jgi:hypothetical protein|nr:hypothetical protein [Accumulibacter sp.]
MRPPPANGDGMAFDSLQSPGVSVVFFARNRLDEDDGLARHAEVQIPREAKNVSLAVEAGRLRAEFDDGAERAQILTILADGVFYTAIARAPRPAMANLRPGFLEIFNSWQIHGRPAAAPGEKP